MNYPDGDHRLVDIHGGDIGPHLDQWRALLGQMTVDREMAAALAAREARMDAEDRAIYRERLNALVKLLPETQGSVFKIKGDLYTARALQASCVWSCGYIGDAALGTPHGRDVFYVIGKKFGKTPKSRVELLLLDAALHNGQALTAKVTVPAKVAKRFGHMPLKTLMRTPDPASDPEHDEKTDTYYVTAQTPGAQKFYLWHWDPLIFAVGVIPDSFNAVAGKISTVLHRDQFLAHTALDSLRLDYSATGPSTEEWESYGVAENVARLATVFRVDSDYKQALMAQSEAQGQPTSGDEHS